jgi:hypothetical protein
MILISTIFYLQYNGFLFSNNIYSLGNYCKKKFSVLNVDHKQGPKEASDFLCKINYKIKIFINYLKIKYGDKKIFIKKLIKKYQSEDLVESKNNTYTDDKLEYNSSKINICIRKIDDGYLFDHYLILFIVIHELTHVIDKEWNTGDKHSNNFWILNTRMLLEAKESGIFENGFIDYSKYPVKYCNGVLINNNPIFDLDLVNKADKLILN